MLTPSRQGGFEQASVLFEWSLSETISTCIRSAGARSSEAEEKPGDNVPVIGPPLPTITGIAAWDSALLEDYHRRKRALRLAAAAAAAEAAAAEAAACEFADEDAAVVAEELPSTPQVAQNRCDEVGDSKRFAVVVARGAEASTGRTIVVPGADSAAAAIPTAAARHQVAGAYSEETDDDSDATASESVDSMSTFCNMTGSSDSEHEGCDSAQEQDGQGGSLDGPERGAGHEVDGEGQHSVPRTNEQPPAYDKVGGGEQGWPSDQGPDEKYLLDCYEPHRVGSSEEGQSPSEGEKPSGMPGRSKSSPLYSRKRTRKLKGLHGALELATRSLRKDGFNAKAYGLRAELEARLGRRDRAIADFKAAASLEVGDPRPRINMVCKMLDWRQKRRVSARSSLFLLKLFCSFAFARSVSL